MRYAATIFVALTVLGCGGENAGLVDPIGHVPVSGKTSLWGMVVDKSGACIPGAVVQVVLAQGAGQTATQTTPCTAWTDYGGFVLTDLTVGVEITLQAKAPGYAVEEKRVVPSSAPQMALLFTPSPMRDDGPCVYHGPGWPWCY